MLVTGYNGQLGYDVVKRLNMQGIECKGVDLQDFDLTNQAQTIEYIESYMPNAVVHCAAYTAVDKAENEKEICKAVNVEGTANIAMACANINAKLLYISTDYVFGGEGDTPHETDDNKEPINYYGKTKYLGELEVIKAVAKYFIIRISWVFGVNGNNFVKTMLRLAKDKKELSIVSDQIGSPTYTYDLAFLICDMLKTDSYGVYHATNEGFCSWYEFACEIFKAAGSDIIALPTTTDKYPTIAKRPKNSRLSKNSLDTKGFSRLPHWKDALARYINELQ